MFGYITAPFRWLGDTVGSVASMPIDFVRGAWNSGAVKWGLIAGLGAVALGALGIATIPLQSAIGIGLATTAGVGAVGGVANVIKGLLASPVADDMKEAASAALEEVKAPARGRDELGKFSSPTVNNTAVAVEAREESFSR
jgi:hypothetical protein